MQGLAHGTLGVTTYLEHASVHELSAETLTVTLTLKKRGAALRDKPQALVPSSRSGVHVCPLPCGAAGALTGEAWAGATSGTQPSADSPVCSTPGGRAKFLTGPQADPVTAAWVASSLRPVMGVSTQ